MTARMLSEPSRPLPPKLPNGLRWTNSQSAPPQLSRSQIRETTAPAAQPNTTAAMPKVSPIHNVPQPPQNVSSRCPASAMETGSHATARPSEIHDNFRSTERCRLNSTAIPARPASPTAAKALPSGRPPGKPQSKEAAPDTSDQMAKITMPESTMTFVLRMVVIGWNEMSAVPMNPVQHRVHPGFGRCVERPMGTPCRDGNLTERLGLLRVPRQRLAAGTGKGKIGRAHG